MNILSILVFDGPPPKQPFADHQRGQEGGWVILILIRINREELKNPFLTQINHFLDDSVLLSITFCFVLKITLEYSLLAVHLVYIIKLCVCTKSTKVHQVQCSNFPYRSFRDQ